MKRVISLIYVRYIVVGGVVGLLSLFLRELIDYAFEASTGMRYGASVAFSYAVGVVVSFYLHRVVTFSADRSVSTFHFFGRFTVVALVSGSATSFAAAVLVQWSSFGNAFGSYRAMAAFAIAALGVSAISYCANAKFVYAGGRGASEPR